MTIKGVVHGKTIDLERDPNVAEGEIVEIEIPKSAINTAEWFKKLEKSAAALTQDEHAESDMAIILEFRKQDRRLPVID